MKKRMITVNLIVLTLGLAIFNQGAFALENGLCRTPPMGWNCWNIFGGAIDETKVKAIANVMVSSGMREAGYIYVCIDDMWMRAGRDTSGNLVPDPVKFPNGLKTVADYLHSLGLKLGIYGDRGLTGCCGVVESGSQGHEVQDAKTWASWGVDYLKYDSCNASLDLRTQYETMRDALTSCGRPIAFSICCWYFVGTWMYDCGNLWRVSNDITDSWASITNIIDTNEKLYMHAGPGHWNDPDMLEVGNGKCTFEEYKSHFSLWCIMAAPLITGCDLRSMSAETQSIILNKELIGIDQDSAGIQGRIVKDNGDLEVWMKPLGSATGTEKAVLLFNRSSGTVTITANWSDLGITGSVPVRDCWAQKDLGVFNGSYSASVPSHGVVVLRLGTQSAITPSPTRTPTATPTGPTRGDVNHSGKIDINDALLIAQYSAGLNPANFDMVVADVNADSAINILDALLVAKCTAGMGSCF